jgi:hypothetical protein
VLVTGRAAAVVGGFDRWRWQSAEDPHVAGRGEALVFTLRWCTSRLLPEVTVIGAEPA